MSAAAPSFVKHICFECHKFSPDIELPTCSRCKAIYACNKECLKKFWRTTHKHHCSETPTDATYVQLQQSFVKAIRNGYVRDNFGFSTSNNAHIEASRKMILQALSVIKSSSLTLVFSPSLALEPLKEIADASKETLCLGMGGDFEALRKVQYPRTTITEMNFLDKVIEKVAAVFAQAYISRPVGRHFRQQIIAAFTVPNDFFSTTIKSSSSTFIVCSMVMSELTVRLQKWATLHLKQLAPPHFQDIETSYLRKSIQKAWISALGAALKSGGVMFFSDPSKGTFDAVDSSTGTVNKEKRTLLDIDPVMEFQRQGLNIATLDTWETSSGEDSLYTVQALVVTKPSQTTTTTTTTTTSSSATKDNKDNKDRKETKKA